MSSTLVPEVLKYINEQILSSHKDAEQTADFVKKKKKNAMPVHQKEH